MTHDADVAAYSGSRGITEVLHFTTGNGLLGIMASGKVLSRLQLNEDLYLTEVAFPNNPVRKDPEWAGYINMSMSAVNRRMFEFSTRQHASKDVWWAVMSFDPEILAHPGVWFVTTNNTYGVAKRGEGLVALEALFAPSVPWGWYGASKTRYAGMAEHLTTCPQAEVLYPRELSLEFLRAIYLKDESHVDLVESWFGLLPNAPRVPVVLKPEVFI